MIMNGVRDLKAGLKAGLKTGVWSVALILSMGLLLGSCRHKSLCYPGGEEVRVVIDWSKAPEGANPGRMTGFFYPVTGGEEIRYDFPEVTGGTVRLAPGHYRFVTFNLGTDVLRFRGEEKFETIESFTSRTTALAGALRKMWAPSAYETMPFGLAPEPLYAARLYDVEVRRRGKGEEVQEIVVYPEAKFVEIDIRILGVNNLGQLQGVSAGLSGIKSSYFIGLDEFGSGSINIPIPLEWGEGEMHGKAYAYGFSEEEPNELTLFAVMLDGKGYYYTYDVTKQIDEQSGKVVVTIVIEEGPDLPKVDPSEIGGGVMVEVESWESVSIHLKMH